MGDKWSVGAWSDMGYKRW